MTEFITIKFGLVGSIKTPISPLKRSTPLNSTMSKTKKLSKHTMDRIVHLNKAMMNQSSINKLNEKRSTVGAKFKKLKNYKITDNLPPSGAQ